MLAGGLGTRIRSMFPDLPKAMIPVNGIPFLELQMNSFHKLGIDSFVLCIGYKAEIVKNYFSGKKFPYDVRFSIESQPLGTGGAIAEALYLLDGEFLIANGDTLVTFDLSEMKSFHHRSKSDLTVLLAKQDDLADYGSVDVNDKWRVVGFQEKDSSKKSGYVNAGVYLATKQVFEDKRGMFSLERDLLPELVQEHRVFGYPARNPFVDIGTPERFLAFKKEAEERL